MYKSWKLDFDNSNNCSQQIYTIITEIINILRDQDDLKMTIVGSDVAKIRRSEEHKVGYYYIEFNWFEPKTGGCNGLIRVTLKAEITGKTDEVTNLNVGWDGKYTVFDVVEKHTTQLQKEGQSNGA